MLVYGDWVELGGAVLMGIIHSEQLRGKEIFSFSYDPAWLARNESLVLDPDLGLYTGMQYVREEKSNFGLFTDSAPDRWGRVLMDRREALLARREDRRPRTLMETDYLLGVFDLYRMGGLRFKLSADGEFLDTDEKLATPPMTSLRTLEEASLRLEEEDDMDEPVFSDWLNLLLSPGASLGGARPKACVAGPDGQLWIAKFPSLNDDRDTGGWEAIVNQLAVRAGVNVAEGYARRFTQDYQTFLTKRFDRVGQKRVHFASAMTLLGQVDGADANAQVSYLQLAEIIVRNGARPDADLEELWRRIVFNICVSNSDDHLRNHGFLLTPKGWVLSPAYDINPIPNSRGLHLNITETDNAQDLELAREVAELFRLSTGRREEIIEQVRRAVDGWAELAKEMGIARSEVMRVEPAFIFGRK